MNATRRRVLFVGSTAYELPLSPELARKWDAVSERLDFRVVARRGGGSGADPRFRLIGSGGRAPRGARFFAALPTVVAREARRFRPDVVVAQSAYEAAVCLPVLRAMRPRPKLLVELHSDPRTASRLYGSPSRRVYARMADRAALAGLRGADGTRAVSGYTAGIARDATGREPTAVFPAYFDLDSFLRDPPRPLPERPQVAWVGVLQRVKNPELLARAWPHVAERMPSARLAVVGAGPLQPEMDALAARFPDTVRMRPWLAAHDVARVLDESTVLAVTSRSEGLGRVILEAFARGRPVVATQVGGIPDLVRPERNGLLVPEDDPRALAAALLRVLEDTELAGRLGGAAAEDSDRFRWTPERYADALAAMIERAVAAG